MNVPEFLAGFLFDIAGFLFDIAVCVFIFTVFFVRVEKP